MGTLDDYLTVEKHLRESRQEVNDLKDQLLKIKTRNNMLYAEV
jgi:hypothetical protein